MVANIPEIRDTYRLEDAVLKGSDLLPTAGGTTYGAEISLANYPGTAKGARLAEVEAVLSLPAITLAELPNGKTLTFSLLGDTEDTVDANSTVLVPDFAVVTGATGTDPIPANVEVGRVSIPAEATYPTIGLRCVSTSTASLAAKEMTLSLAF